MAYILNTNIADNKSLINALGKIYGLEKGLNIQICDQLGFSARLKYKNLNANTKDKLSRCISQKYLTGLELKRVEKRNKSRYITINSYKGFRYIQALPCRGQRTHGNARTARKNSFSQHKHFSKPQMVKQGKRFS